MDKNYYEILEIDRHASEEIIKKAYTTLAKKYHPDLQSEDMKTICEEKFKLINEAYEILSVPEKRKEYDDQLNRTIISKEDFDAIYLENQKLKDIINNIKNEHTQNFKYQSSYTISNTQKNDVNNNNASTDYYNNSYIDELQKAKEKAYYDAYIQDLKNRGYKIKYKKTFKDYIKSFFALICTFFILFALFQIPFIQNIFLKNEILSTFINIITSFFK